MKRLTRNPNVYGQLTPKMYFSSTSQDSAAQRLKMRKTSLTIFEIIYIMKYGLEDIANFFVITDYTTLMSISDPFLFC